MTELRRFNWTPEVGEVDHRRTESVVGVRGDWGGWRIRVSAEPGDGGTTGTLTISGCGVDPLVVKEEDGVSLSMFGGEWSELPRVLRLAADEVERSTPRVNERY